MKVKTWKYKKIDVTMDVDEEGKFVASALGIYKGYKNDTTGEKWDEFKSAELRIYSMIDNFLKITPKTYDELAIAIQETLVWTGYEDCHVDSLILKVLIENFLKVYKD